MKPLSRRTLLRGAGVSMALPALEAMLPVGRAGAAAELATRPQRFVAINIPLGFLSGNFFPTGTGKGYQTSSYLSAAEELRDDFTVISGTSHPGVDGGHAAEKSFLTAAPHPGARSFKNSISLDQVLARQLGNQTRFASLTLGDQSLSWSANGVSVPSIRRPADAFAKLFLSGSDREVATQKRELSDGRSIMDTVLGDAKTMQGRVSSADRDKLDQYFTAVRETERRLEKAQSWSGTPKPEVEVESPGAFDSADLIGALRAHFEIIRLALQTDSTRVIALGGSNHSQVVPIKGVDQGYHSLSHHGKNPQMMAQLELIDRATIKAWVDFLKSLKSSGEGDSNLLDQTQVLLGSNLGNASGHLTTNLPIVLAGGDFSHGQHLAFDQKNNEALPKLFISMMQGLGVEADTFASNSGTLPGLSKR